MTATRVLIVDDDERFAAVVQSVLTDDGYDVVGILGSASDLGASVDALTPDVVVLDLILRDGDGLDAAEELVAQGRDVRVVVFSTLFDQRIARDTLASGFGYVEKAAGVEALELAIEATIGLPGEIDLRETTAHVNPETRPG